MKSREFSNGTRKVKITKQWNKEDENNRITKTAKRLNMNIGTIKMQMQTSTTRFADANEDINIRRK
jgi:hypothetical protein